LARGAKVRVVDDASGHWTIFEGADGEGAGGIRQSGFAGTGVTRTAMNGVITVFHFGGGSRRPRLCGNLHQAGPASNFFLDGIIFLGSGTRESKEIVLASFGMRFIQTHAVGT